MKHDVAEFLVDSRATHGTTEATRKLCAEGLAASAAHPFTLSMWMLTSAPFPFAVTFT